MLTTEPNNPDLYIEAIQKFFYARNMIGLAVGDLFGDDFTICHLRQDTARSLEILLRQIRVEVDGALSALGKPRNEQGEMGSTGN